MKTEITKQGDRLCVTINGELDHHVAKDVRLEIDKELDADLGIKNIEFNLEKMNFMDSSGIGVFMGRFKIVEKRGGGIFVSHVRPQVQKLLSLSGLMNIVTVI